MITDPDASLRRRLRFDGDCRFLFDRIGARLGGRTRLHRIPERMAMAGFDLLECLRTASVVPAPGNPRTAVGQARRRLPQHPRYLGYWHDPARRVLAGMELGVDVIRCDGTYYVIELNLSAGRPRAWVLRHPGEVDPGLPRLVEFARSYGFGRLVAFRESWPDDYRDHFPVVGREAGVDAVAVDPVGRRGRPADRMVALPDPPEPDTMYVTFSSRHAAVDHFVHDKGCTTSWLAEHLPERSDPPVRSVPTRSTPFTPAPEADPRWPDLVVKLASWDRGDYVRFVKLKPGTDLLRELGMESPEDIPAVLGLGAGRRLYARLTGRDRVLYQPFIRSSLTPDGKPFRFRIHLLVTPLGSAFLSATTSVSETPFLQELPPGVVNDARPFLAPVGEGRRYYEAREPDAETEAELRGVGAVLGDALDRAVRATFECGP
jgi:hypothetical protein